ncbi:MAG: type VI secretion system baseplate subunit TssG [Planctomycetes bacterium]|nr:type VI secretion system baseplate subunit TssG [Planctomycetota bacterium]
MAGEPGTAAHDLMAALEAEPYAFDFFQAVRRLQCAHRDKPPIGTSHRPADDPIRFGQVPSLAFAASAIAAVHPATDDRPGRMLVNFTGLLGANAPLPLHDTEYAISREMEHDASLSAFLDIFHHRAISLLYRAWAVGRPAVAFDRHDQADRFATYIAGFFGAGTDAFRNRDRAPDLAKLFFSGRLACQTRPAEGLAAILSSFFGVEARIEEFVGQWVAFPPPYRCRLGESPDTGTLGGTAIVGGRVWDCQMKFRVVLGAMDLDDYERMLPGGDSFGRLVDWVRTYVADELDWDVQLVLRREEIPTVQLGRQGRLGWSTWLHAGAPRADADDLILRPFAAAEDPDSVRH